MNLNNVAVQMEAFLMQAERWLQNERSESISCLVLCCGVHASQAGGGSIDLPENHRKNFGAAPRTYHRSSEGRVLEIAYQGDLNGWWQLFSDLTETCQQMLPDIQNEWESLNPLDHWVLTLVELQRLARLPTSAGGQRMHLDRRISFSIKGNALEGFDARLPIDRSLGGELVHISTALKQSAEDYGYYAKFPDLRYASVHALRLMRAKQLSLNKYPDSHEKNACRSIKELSNEEREKYLERADLVLQWHEADPPTPKNTSRSQGLTRWIESVPGVSSVEEYERIRAADRKCRSRYGFTRKKDPGKSHLEIQRSWVKSLRSGTFEYAV